MHFLLVKHDFKCLASTAPYLIMSIKFKRKLTAFIGLSGIIVLCWYFFLSDNTGGLEDNSEIGNQLKEAEVVASTINEKLLVDTKEQTENHTQREKTWDEQFNHPINFWGKVVDENGQPLAGATVQVILYDDPTGGYSGLEPTKIKTRSDAKGNFSILEKFAAGISVNASLSGYTAYYDPKTRENRSRFLMAYSDKRFDQKIKYSTKAEPTVLILQNRDKLSDLIHIKETRQVISSKGSILNLLLEKKGHKIDMNLRCMSSAPNPFKYEKYDWEAEIGIKGGRIQEIKDTASQVAPEGGYVQAFQLKMPVKKTKWSRDSPSNRRDFWIKLDGGSYARAQIKFVTGRKHLVYVQAWINTDGNDFVIER